MKVLVIGDIILDINFFSEIKRNAPEANHIPVNLVKKTEYKLGGASNVASIINNLGIDTTLLSVIGRDNTGIKLQIMLKDNKIKNKIFLDETRISCQKNRIFTNNTLITRFDMEDNMDINELIEQELYNFVTTNDFDIIVLSDYNKGVLTVNFTKNIIKYANENSIYTFIDPKVNNSFKYKNCFCIKPNINEARELSGKDEIKYMFNEIKSNLGCENIIITAGENGVFVNDETTHYKIKEKIKTVDVTGCGDLFLGVLIYAFITFFDIHYSCKIATYFASKSTTTVGNGEIKLNDIKMYKKENPYKLKELPKIINDTDTFVIDQLSNYSNVVFTNGCFDILHSAHIQLLKFCKDIGDILVVGLNSDKSIKRLKGENRPINDIHERALILSLFEYVDYIIIFDDDTPYNILKNLEPEVIVKGGDYKKEEIIGGEFAKRIELYNYIENKSTTNIINKINKNK